MPKNLNREQLSFWFSEAAPGAVARVLRQVLNDGELGSVLRGHIDYSLVAVAINTRHAGRYVMSVRQDLLAIAGWNQFKPLFDKADDDSQLAIKKYLIDVVGPETYNLHELFFASGPVAQYIALCMTTYTEPDKDYVLKLVSERS